MTDLLGELRHATLNVRQGHLDRLRSLGVDIAWLADAPLHPFGIGQCEASRDGLYQPLADAGPPHFLLPVIEDGALIDLCAFRPEAPGTWLLRTGNGWALGLDRGLGRYMWHKPADPEAGRHQVGAPTRLFSDPLDWLRGRGEGICVLDWDCEDVHGLDALPAITCSTPLLAALLRHALVRPPRLPTISVLESHHVA